jgi:hypothetical protein
VRDLPLPKTGEGAILGLTTTPNPGNVGLHSLVPPAREKTMASGGAMRRHFRVSIFVLAFAFSGLVAESSEGAVAGPDSGKYCINDGSTMLLVRPADGGGLEFGIAYWGPRSRYFSVFGVARPDSGGWRFRENMNAANPFERCEALIARMGDGGYSFSVTQAGQCQSYGGQGISPQPGSKMSFPARSRQGEMPRNKKMNEAVSLEAGRVNCDTPHRGR